MKPGASIVLASAARLYAPLLVLFALTLVALRAPGAGVGFVAGLAFALALVLHALVFGAAASRAAFPPVFARCLLALGVIAAVIGAGVPAWPYAARLIEAGAMGATIGAAALIVSVLFGRAPTLREGEW